MAKPPFPWIGSKEKIAPYILQLFPPKLTQYVEPFGGSGAVLLALPPDPNRLDIYNDLDAELVNLYSCIKECSNVLLRELKFLPIHGRTLFEYYRDFVAHKEVYFQNVQAEIECLGDRSCFTEEQAGELLPIFQERLALYDVKRAAAYYLAIRGSFSGTINSFGVKGVDVERFLKLFPPVSARLKDVPLENKNALQLIRERDKKGSLIYADPPWHYDRKHGSGVAENHYPTMSIEEICALPVSELAAKDSALFLWATFPQLNEAFRVIDAWGFKYKTLAFLWLKQNRKADSWFYGMGFWTRSNAEVCLLATRGRPKRQCAGIHQFVISHIEQHSKKPDEVRDKIVKLMGDQPRVELFARQKTPGWDVWGNEVNCTLTMPERKG